MYTIFSIRKTLLGLLANTCNSPTGEEFTIEAFPPFALPRESARGDLSSNAAMMTAKRLRRPPKEVAQIFRDALETSELVDHVEIAGPGFLNIFLSDLVLKKILEEILTELGGYGRSTVHSGKRALVEFVSANPTGPLHVGHIRGAVVGDTVAELMAAVGYEVQREYYYNDAGAQMRNLGLSVQARYRELYGLPFTFPEDGYKGTHIVEIAEEIRREHGDSRLEEGWEWFTEYAAERLMKRISEDLAALRISFDSFVSEKSLYDSGEVKSTLLDLAAKHATYEKDNAVWLRSTLKGDDKDRVLVKSDGEPTYVTPDIAYHRFKLRRGFDRLVNVMGHDHHSQAERVKYALELLGLETSSLHYLLTQMVSLKAGDRLMKFSKREGELITMREMIEDVSADVTRYFFIQRSYTAQMTFDWELAKSRSMDNPVYYLQYVHARACSIAAKAVEKGISAEIGEDLDWSILAFPRERELLIKLAHYPAVILDAADRLEPHLLTNYLEDLAKTFHAYYQAQRVLNESDPRGSKPRFLLVRAVRQVMENALGILKVTAPEKM